MLSRRNFGRAAIGLVAASGGVAAASHLASEPALAASGHESWVANGAEITAYDGSVDELTFGDSGGSDEFHLDWEGLGSSEDVNFRILVKGEEDGDSGGWAGGSETAYEELAIATPGVSLSGNAGSDTYSWEDVFGEAAPVDIDGHTEINVSDDFSADDEGQTRERDLAVDLEVWIDGYDGSNGPDGDALGDRKTATATITVTNQEASIQVGGAGSFEISSSAEVDQ